MQMRVRVALVISRCRYGVLLTSDHDCPREAILSGASQGQNLDSCLSQ